VRVFSSTVTRTLLSCGFYKLEANSNSMDVRRLEFSVGLLETHVSEMRTELVEVPASASLAKVIGMLREKNAYEVFVVEDSEVSLVSIRDIIKAKNIHTRKASSLAVRVPIVNMESELADVARLMTHHRTRALPIVDDRRIVGEITASSVCQALDSSDALKFSISKIMASNPVTLDAEDPLGKAKALMNRREIDHLPVLDGGEIVGMLTSHRVLDSIIPPERPMRSGWKPEARRVDQLSVSGLMERPLICDMREEASSVLKKLISMRKSYAIIGFGQELQGIVTFRDFVALLVQPERKTVPVYIVGLPEEAFQAEGVRAKFTRSIELLRKSYPEILEARSTIKTSRPRSKKGRERYEVKAFVYTPRKTFVHSESGWDLLSLFDVLSGRLKRIMARKRVRSGSIQRRRE
jgi:CBS domain-containing protein